MDEEFYKNRLNILESMIDVNQDDPFII